ncbi:arsenate reductase [Iodidimonas muriae]|uniref:Arsenate reductase n=1 Tax=Iodidimonas muriae TaxID=261467 RepID=A0ABQ2L9Y7_9PROT|nr:arsenate reductase (glutaredoxin) [Iodidimonas muriae]GER05812.1 arsenate reductase [Kordiimonadales bacterium JCM 17843]GGO06981.1 arsenate reductase [Iodidimonas muriae]
MTTKIWHNPRCSKSRQTLALLEEQGINPEIRLYLENAPTAQDIEQALTLLGKAPRDLMRRGEALYKDLGLDDPSLSHADLVAAMAAHPKLIERPVVFHQGKAALGRPPEQVLKIL